MAVNGATRHQAPSMPLLLLCGGRLAHGYQDQGCHHCVMHRSPSWSPSTQHV